MNVVNSLRPVCVLPRYAELCVICGRQWKQKLREGGEAEDRLEGEAGGHRAKRREILL